MGLQGPGGPGSARVSVQVKLQSPRRQERPSGLHLQSSRAISEQVEPFAPVLVDDHVDARPVDRQFGPASTGGSGVAGQERQPHDQMTVAPLPASSTRST